MKPLGFRGSGCRRLPGLLLLGLALAVPEGWAGTPPAEPALLSIPTARRPGLEVTALWGSWQPSYWMGVSELQARWRPGWAWGPGSWQLSARSRAYGSFWFVSPDSMDGELRLGWHLPPSPEGWSLGLETGAEGFLRRLPDERRQAFSGGAPFFAFEPRWLPASRWNGLLDGLSLRLPLSAALYSDGVAVQVQAELAWTWDAWGLVLAGEGRVLSPWTGAPGETRWRTLAGLRWRALP